MASYRRKPEEAVPILLDWLKKTKERKIKVSKPKSPKPEQFEDIQKTLEGMQDLFPKLKEWEESFMKEISALEKDINVDIEDGTQLDKIRKKLTFMEENAKSLENNIKEIKIPRMEESGAMALQQEPEAPARKLSEDWLRLKVEEEVLVSSAMANLQASYDVLDLQSKLCLLCFSIFPDNSVIKKRPLINWWIAEGFLKPQKKKTADDEGSNSQPAKSHKKTAENEGSSHRSEKKDEEKDSHQSPQLDMNEKEMTNINQGSAAKDEKKTTDQEGKTGDKDGEAKFKELMRLGFIQPGYNTKRPDVNSCKMHPWIRRMLISIAKKAEFFGFDSTNTPCNNDPLSSNDSSSFRHGCLVSGGRVPKEEDLLTLFNVNEQYLNLKADWFSKLKKLVVLQLGRWQTSAARHLEVENNEFLNQLRSQKQLKYLSFHGVSRITELPHIVELINLEILELRACHNLEKLPGDFSLLTKLTHLDLSECYLLEGMPKGLEKLHSLQVLKGFLIGSPWSTEYKFASLAQLKKLRKLSICIGREAAAGDLDLDNLKDITSLRILSITWEKVDSKDEGEQPSTIANPMPISKAPEALENKGEQSSSTAANLKEPVVSDNKAEQSSKTASSTVEKASDPLENKGEQSIRPADSAMEVSKAPEIQGDQSSPAAKSTREEESVASEKPAELKKKEKPDLWCLPCWRPKEVVALMSTSENKEEQARKPAKSTEGEASKVHTWESKISFPPGLEKLDLWCLPHWPNDLNPSNFNNLKRLYIRGGKLNNFPKFKDKWKAVEILRLKYLKNLTFELKEMRGEFPERIYLEKVKCKGKDHEGTTADEEIRGSGSGSKP